MTGVWSGLQLIQIKKKNPISICQTVTPEYDATTTMLHSEHLEKGMSYHDKQPEGLKTF